jgi:chromosome segregation ATPase
MTLSPCRDVPDLFREGRTFQEYWSLGMEAIANRSKRILERAEDAKSPQRILLPSLLKSRNQLRAKYRELRADCKRWRNQVAAVERSRSSWRQRAETGEATAQREQAERVALESQLQQIREQSQEREAELAALRAQLAASEEAEKKGR